MNLPPSTPDQSPPVPSLLRALAGETLERWHAFLDSPEAQTVPASAWPSYRRR